MDRCRDIEKKYPLPPYSWHKCDQYFVAPKVMQKMKHAWTFGIGKDARHEGWLRKFNPDVIVVNAGANDIYSASGGNQKTIIKQRYELVIENLREFYGSSPHIVLMNAYGWDINEPANYSYELLSNL